LIFIERRKNIDSIIFNQKANILGLRL